MTTAWKFQILPSMRICLWADAGKRENVLFFLRVQRPFEKSPNAGNVRTFLLMGPKIELAIYLHHN